MMILALHTASELKKKKSGKICDRNTFTGCVLFFFQEVTGLEMSVFELLAIAREGAGADYVNGDRILCEKRYAKDTEHMLEFRVLGGHEPYGSPGDYCRLFLTEKAYRKMWEKGQQKKIRIIRYAKVRGNTLAYGPPAERPASRGEEPLPAGKKKCS